MPRISSILWGAFLGAFALTLATAPAAALVEDSRTGPFKPNVTNPYRFGYRPKPNVLPGTTPKKKCIPHGLARCIFRPRPLSPFAGIHRQKADASHPLFKRNQPFQPEPSYEVAD